MPNLERFIKDIQDKLPTLDFEGKRLALDMLGIKVWLDSHNVEITSVMPITDDAIVTTQSSRLGHNYNICIPFKIAVNTSK